MEGGEAEAFLTGACCCWQEECRLQLAELEKNNPLEKVDALKPAGLVHVRARGQVAGILILRTLIQKLII
jgi:hypothetical protein